MTASFIRIFVGSDKGRCGGVIRIIVLTSRSHGICGSGILWIFLLLVVAMQVVVAFLINLVKIVVYWLELGLIVLLGEGLSVQFLSKSKCCQSIINKKVQQLYIN